MRLFEKLDRNESSSQRLVRELIRAMWEQGFAEEDILNLLARLGMARNSSTFALEEVMEKSGVEGIEERKSVLRRELEEVLWEWTRDLETRRNESLGDVEERLFKLEKEFNLLRRALEKNSFGGRDPQE